MSKAVAAISEYRNLPLAQLQESPTNPRRRFDEHSLNIRPRASAARAFSLPCLCGLSPIRASRLSLEPRRYRAAQMAEAPTVPVRIVNLTDAEALEAQLVELPATPRRSPSRGSAGIQGPAQLGRPEVQHRADRGKGGKIAGVLCCPSPLNRTCRASGRGVLCRGLLSGGHRQKQRCARNDSA